MKTNFVPTATYFDLLARDICGFYQAWIGGGYFFAILQDKTGMMKNSLDQLSYERRNN